MSWKYIYVSIMMGAFIGTFCAWGYVGLTFPQGEPVEVRAQPRLLNQNSSSPPVETPYPAMEKEAPEVPPEDNRVSGDGSLTRLEADKNSYQGSAVQERTRNPINKAFEADGQALLEHGNKSLSNYNIMFFGIEDQKLQMLTVYSINQRNNWKSGTVFIPTDTLVPGGKNLHMADYFYQNGPEKAKKLVEKVMEIDINYYVMVDRNLLLEMEPYLDPIYISGEKVNIPQLFTKEITPDDEIILASLLKNLTNPSIYFGVLPKLILACKQYIKTDFQLNWTSLWVHYQIAKNIDTSSVTKKILSGRYLTIENQRYWVPTQHAWKNMIYEVTK
jgi:anionic cell wall polymer biosynthesis LytR-Cps2A-Psr (LCP) family protein